MLTTRYDLVIRGGSIADGLGGEPFTGDVAIAGGRIAAVGKVSGSGRDEIDAGGMLVTPGFVDIHTHYDAQVTWSNSLRSSANHGVTTALMGNCGVGFAPCKPDERETLMRLMEGVEDIPMAVMAAGLPWEWESFPQFLDFLDRRSCDVDFAAQVPHGAVRVYVMGRRGAEREPATEPDIVAMAHVVQEAVAAGALGFSTSRTMNHRTKAGALSPVVTAAEEELQAIAAGLGAIGKGVLQMVDDFTIADEAGSPEFDMWQRIAAASGRPLSFALVQSRAAPERWRYLLDRVARANDGGLTMRGQVTTRPIGSLYGLELSSNPFSRCASYREIEALPLAERVRALRSTDVRARILAEAAQAFARQPARQNRITVEEMYAFGDPPNYSPDPDDRFGARAERLGISIWDLLYDALLQRDGKAMIYSPGSGFAYHNLDAQLELMRHRDTVVAIGDGGAHVAQICDVSYPTHLLTYWTRDRRGERLSLAGAVRMLTHDAARAIGLDDRGLIAAGYKADLNVIDYDKLTLYAPRMVQDYPAGGARLVQDADGYVATVLSGAVTYRGGAATGAVPGRLIRGAQSAPRT